jgi:hypothetical protein
MMSSIRHTMNRVSVAALIAVLAAPLGAQRVGSPDTLAPNPAIAKLVGRLDLARYKATIKGLTQFGDRRQGTDRNRAAIDWIEKQLQSYGCPTERLTYDYRPPEPGPRVARGPNQAVGGGRLRGNRRPTRVNADSLAQADATLRALNTPQSVPGQRQEVYCTKVGTTHPNEMYIVGGHMDGIGWGEAANDDGSGTALVMEVARVLSAPDVVSERTIRFVLWNNEESGLDGAVAYVAQRSALQGKESPAGSGKYPEPKWLGMIQHDMMMFDHGMPRADSSMSTRQRAEADVNIEFQSHSMQAAASQALAWRFHGANEKYATDYPASVGPHMTNTDSYPFQDLVAAISLRENERGTQIGAGWDPQWHQPTDLFSTYTDDDFRLGLNAAQTTLGAIAELSGVTVR